MKKGSYGDFDSSQYNNPQSDTVVMNDQTGVVQTDEERKLLSPWDQIVQSSKLYGIDIKEPNTNCKKCYGKGHIAIDSETKIPLACNCIFPPTSGDKKQQQHNEQPAKLSREQRRKLQRQLKKTKGKVDNVCL